MKVIRFFFMTAVLAATPLLTTACFPDPTGSLRVTLVPQTAVDAGAQWNVDSGEWQGSGSTVDGLSVGTHEVFFKDVAGWVTPESLMVSVEKDALSEATEGYMVADEGEIVESSGPTPVTGGSALNVALSDGSRLSLPATEATGALTQISLGRAENGLNLNGVDAQSAGAARVVQFDSFDPTTMGVPAARFAPQITLPASIISGLDKNTIAVYRVADLFINDTSYPRHASSLPVSFAENGDLLVTDFYFPDSIMSDLALDEARKSGKSLSCPKADILNPREIAYVVGTFAGSYNWAAEPVLARFYPDDEDSSAPGRVSWEDLSAERQEEEDGNVETNIVVLVHGHNEEEKLGYEMATTDSPWNFTYKRDVWTQFYKYVAETAPDMAKCTAFYEFIYPTYWPIFTPQTGRDRLDQAFAEKVNSLVAGMSSPGKTLKLYILAHSMGGVVARAGIQLFNTGTHEAFQKLVTWGSPHMGSPLVSLRYVLGAPPGIYRAGPEGVVTFPLDNIDNTLFALRRSIDNQQVDAPGTRDFRWANSHTDTPRGLALDTLFSMTATEDLWNRYDLENGTEIYSQNLNLLNANDVYRLSDKYNAFFGVTTRRAQVIFPLSNWFKPTVDTTGPPLGAKVMFWLVDDAKLPFTPPFEAHKLGNSDGAVPIASMAAAGVAGAQSYLGDIDHEQYYGAPAPNGSLTQADIELASYTSGRTLAAFGITCPPPGQRTFHLSRSETVQDPIRFYEDINDTTKVLALTLQHSVSMDVTVNFDGSVEPTIFDYTTSPPSDNIKKVANPGYLDPITVTGTYNFDVSPKETRIDFVGWNGQVTSYSIYTFKKAEFQHYARMTGNQSSEEAYLQAGAGFSWTFTRNPAHPYSPSFSPGAIRVTYTVTNYDIHTNEVYETKDKTYSLYGYPVALKVMFGIPGAYK